MRMAKLKKLLKFNRECNFRALLANYGNFEKQFSFIHIFF